LEVFAAMRAIWPAEKPMSVRISATDWVEGGITGDDAVEIARAFQRAGVDLMDVSAGQTSIRAQPVYGRMFQTPFADRIRNEVGIATMAVGNITEYDHLNSIIAAGRADLCALARPHLTDPHFALRAAATPRAAVAGLAMFGAYAIALAALEIAEAAPVAALRETSVVMATAAAALFAHQRVPASRVAGAVVVVGGIAAIALT